MLVVTMPSNLFEEGTICTYSQLRDLQSFTLLLSLFLLLLLVQTTSYYIMATEQLDVSTPNGADGMTVCLSEKTRVVGHSAFQYKSGYMTVSRYNESTTKWRSVHLAKKSCSILLEQTAALLTALDSGESKQVKLTRRQFVMMTKFRKTGACEDIRYISLLHPYTEVDTLENAKDCNHAKTINLTREEFVKLAESLPKLMEKMGTPREQKSEPDETETVRAYRWLMTYTGMTSQSLFLTPEMCKSSVLIHLTAEVTEAVPMDDVFDYKIIPEEVPRPSKIVIVEQVYYTLLLEKIFIPMNELLQKPPSMKMLREANSRLKKSEVVEVSTSIAAKLGNKRLYLVPEAFDYFDFVCGREKVMTDISDNGISCNRALHARLIDACYIYVCKQSMDSMCYFADTVTDV